jgi:outer membrane protein assembly factor BamB
MTFVRTVGPLVLMLVALAACQGRNEALPGTRIPIRPDEAPAASPSRAAAVAIPPAVMNADWTHRNGSAPGRLVHPALRAQPQLIWSVELGQGDAKRRRLLTGPIVAGGLIYAMDAGATLSAVTRSGQVAWRRSLVPAEQVPDSGPGGGMAAADGVIYATTGFGEVFALDPRTGGTIWKRTLDAPVQAPPLVYGGRVIAVQRDDIAVALDARTGETLWTVQATGGTGLMGGASPAADGPLVIIPFSSGELLGVLGRNGTAVWGTAITGGRRALARNRINDVSGDPVIVGSTVYASNQSGRSIRLDTETGERDWTIGEGSYGPASPVGNSVFLVSDEGALVRVVAETGEIVWSRQLPEFFPARNFLWRKGKPWRAVPYYGPILAGGRLWVASADGWLRAFSPVDASLLASVQLPGGAAAAPAVAGGVMYVTTREGQLLAFQ